MRFSRRLSEWQVAAAAMFCCGWGGNQFTPLLSLYRSHDGFSEVVVDALLAAYVLGLAPALLVGGGLSDRHGRRRLMLIALLSCGVGSLALSLDNLPGLAVGRLLSGVGIGLAMAVGTTWVVELSVRRRVPPARGARRASLSLTAGLGMGPAVAGVLAQFGPLPASLPYWVHVAVTAPVLALVACAGAETVTAPVVADRGTASSSEPGERHEQREHQPLAALSHPRFRRLILPLAPWIFGAAGIAYATVPEAVDGHVGHWSLLYATVLTVVAMAAGFLAQPLAHRLDDARVPRSIGLALAVVTLGMAFAALTVQLQLAWAGGIITAITLGSGLGMAMVAGLLEVQRLAPPAEHARTTGVFYALAYIGFLAPVVIALAGHWVTTTASLWVLTALAATCALSIASAVPRARPRSRAVSSARRPSPSA